MSCHGTQSPSKMRTLASHTAKQVQLLKGLQAQHVKCRAATVGYDLWWTRTGRAYGGLSSPSRSNSAHQATSLGRSEMCITTSPGANTAIRSPRISAQSLSAVT